MRKMFDVDGPLEAKDLDTTHKVAIQLVGGEELSFTPVEAIVTTWEDEEMPVVYIWTKEGNEFVARYSPWAGEEDLITSFELVR